MKSLTYCRLYIYWANVQNSYWHIMDCDLRWKLKFVKSLMKKSLSRYLRNNCLPWLGEPKFEVIETKWEQRRYDNNNNEVRSKQIMVEDNNLYGSIPTKLGNKRLTQQVEIRLVSWELPPVGFVTRRDTLHEIALKRKYKGVSNVGEYMYCAIVHNDRRWQKPFKQNVEDKK